MEPRKKFGSDREAPLEAITQCRWRRSRFLTTDEVSQPQL